MPQARSGDDHALDFARDEIEMLGFEARIEVEHARTPLDLVLDLYRTRRPSRVFRHERNLRALDLGNRIGIDASESVSSRRVHLTYLRPPVRETVGVR